MKKYRFFCALLALILLLSSLPLSLWADPDEPETDEAGGMQTDDGRTTDSGTRYADYTALLTAEEYNAKCSAALLIELKTDTVIYEKNPSEIVYPASLTKIMTCLLAIEKCEELGKSLDDHVTASSTAFNGLDDAGSTAGIQPGDELTVRELLYCIMLESANEACNIVAEYLAGSAESYVEWMNDRAEALGCTHTHFVNTHGLHDPNHYTTAFDLAVITETAIENETFLEIAKRETYEIKSEKYSGMRQLSSTNYLIREAYPEYYYNKAIGIKTGYTSAAGRCLISMAEEDKDNHKGLRLLAIVLGTQDDDYAADGLRYRSFVETKKLYEYGFENFKYAELLSHLDAKFQVPMTGADESRGMVLKPASDVVCLLPKDYDEGKVEKTWTLYGGSTTLAAPVEKDQEVGIITVSYDGVVIGSTTLLTLRAAAAQTDAKKVVNQARVFFQRFWWVLPALLGLVLLLFLALVARYYIIRSMQRSRRSKQRQQTQRRDKE